MSIFPCRRIVLLVCVLSVGTACRPAMAAEGYRFENDLVKYESGSNTGLDPRSVSGSSFSFPRPRPGVPFDVPAFGELPENAPSFPRREVGVMFAEEAGVDREAVLRFGFPLPKGGVFDSRCVEFLGPDHEPLPAQYSVISRWPDGSLKWLLITSRISIPANGTQACTVAVGKGVRRQEQNSPLDIAEDEKAAVITTGPLKVEIDKARFNLIKRAFADRDADGKFEEGEEGLRNDAPGVALVRPDEKVFSTSALPPEKWEIEERGPERIVVKVSGKYGSGNGESWMRYVTRLTFSAGSSRVEIAHTHINDDLTREFSDFKSLGLDFLAPQNITAVLTDFQEPEEAGTRFLSARSLSVFQSDDRQSTWDVDGRAQLGGRAQGAWTLTQRNAAAGLVVNDFWQRWPKAFHAERDRVRIGLLPGQPDATFGSRLPYHLMFPFVDGNYRFKWGMSSTERLTVDFSGKVPRKQLLAEARFPLVAVIQPGWYAETKALGAIPAPDGSQFQVWDDFVKRSFDAHCQLSAQQREFGFFNYGDWFGERKRNWGNNEYDRAHCFFQQFARTGDTGYFRLAMQAARHQADVDIVHAYPDPYFIGSNHQHSIGHTGVWEGPNSPRQATWSHKYDSHTDGTNGHTWSNGMVDAWCLAGEARVMDAALELGEHLTWAVAPLFKSLGTHERSAGWSLKALMGIYAARPDPAYLDAASHIAKVAAESQTRDLGGAWAHKLPADHSPDQGVGNCPFLIGILLTALAEYHEQTNDPAVMAALESGCTWLKNSWNEQYTTWPYSADPQGKPLSVIYPAHLNPLIANALAYVGRATSNDEYMQIVDKALARSFWFSASEGVGKELSELMNFTPDTLAGLAEYFRKAAPAKAAGLLSNKDTRLRDEILLAFPSGPDFWLRGPRKRSVFLSLTGKVVHGLAVRKLYGSAKTDLDSGRFAILDSGGVPVAAKDFKTTEKLGVPFEMGGNAGDEFEARIEDEITGAWNTTAEGARLVVASGEGLHFAGINQQRFWFFVPEGTKKFDVKVRGIHHGEFGAGVIDPDGRVAAFASASNSNVEPAIGQLPQKQVANTIEVAPEAAQTGKLWSVGLWAAGDITCELSGIPPFLAMDPQNWFQPRVNDPR